jgi:CheY-like chemotaxis protein
MSGLENFLAPFSHLLFANRNLDIVVLCFVLFAVAIHALNNYWRAERLERDLSSARSNASTSPAGRRYSSGPAIEEAAESGGPLPPVKGGRTYARNLGSALQKAGMSGPQIYSPPTPAGFSPNTNAPQPIGQQGMGQPPYAAPVPWGPAAPSAPWAFPAGQGRNAPAPMPTPAPFYQPQPHQPAPQPTAMPAAPNGPVFGPPPAPSQFPAAPTGPFVPPAFQPAANASPNQATQHTFGPPPAVNPMAPAPLPLPGMSEAPGQEVGDGSRRGKPKRRRFNFNVLENLEKMVQTKPAEPLPPSGWTPPAQPVASAPLTAQPATPALTPAPAPQPELPAKAVEAAPSQPFFLGKSAEAAKQPPAETPPVAGNAPTEEEATELASDSSDEPALEPTTAETDEDEQPAVEAQPRHERRSMRSMMFGEEIAAARANREAAQDQEPVSSTETGSEPLSEATSSPSAEAQPESESPAAQSSWSFEPWTRREEPASAEQTSETVEGSAAPSSETSAETESQAEPEQQPAADSSTSSEEDRWKSESSSDYSQTWNSSSESDPWKSSVDTSSDAEAGAVAGEAASAELGNSAIESDQPVVAEAPELPVSVGNGDNSGAGTLVIIEDDQTTASYYETLFKGNGYRVEIANDGVSGVDLCARVQPQVILLDVMMPRQNGILVLQTLRASDETKNTPVVVMSNFSEPTLIKRALQLGALEYVIKTQVEGPALLEALPRWMNREKAFAAA